MYSIVQKEKILHKVCQFVEYFRVRRNYNIVKYSFFSFNIVTI